MQLDRQIVVYGAGAVGGGLGGLMHLAGLDVVLVARGDHLAAIRAHGLVLGLPEGTRTVDVPAVGGASEVDWSRPSAVVLTVKSQQTAAALEDLVAWAPSATPIACVQNGVANERACLRHFSEVVGVNVVVPATHLEPGAVSVGSALSPGILDCGAYPTGGSAAARMFSQAFTAAGFASRSCEVMAWKHRKLVMNLGNAVDACFDPGEAAEELRRRATEEGVRVLETVGTEVVDAGTERARREGLTPTHEQVTGSRGAGSSSRQSLLRGTGTIESDYLNGEIVLLARLHGLTAPVNQLLQETADRMARARARPGSGDADALLAALS
jgi:2-dehydropantoate 2-reductase